MMVNGTQIVKLAVYNETNTNSSSERKTKLSPHKSRERIVGGMKIACGTTYILERRLRIQVVELHVLGAVLCI